jgi:uncharacterized protein (DUF885 family)
MAKNTDGFHGFFIPAGAVFDNAIGSSGALQEGSSMAHWAALVILAGGPIPLGCALAHCAAASAIVAATGAKAAAADSLAKPSSTANAADPGRDLDALFAQEWERGLRERPEFASEQGDTRYNDRWNDHSAAAIEAGQAADRDALKRLHAIDRSGLDEARRLNYDTFEWLLQQEVERQHFREYLRPLDHKYGPQLADWIVEVSPFRSETDYRNYIKRLQALPARIDQDIALMKQGLAAGNTPPQVLIERVPAQLDKQIVTDPAQSPFYRPFVHPHGSVEPQVMQALRSQAQTAIRGQLAPAFRTLRRFIVDTYLPGCRASIGASELPDGRAYYQFLVRDQTTTALAVDDIHETGLREVARLRKAIEAVRIELGFTGTMADLYRDLRTNPKFFYASPDELFQAYQALGKRIDPELVRVFRTIPRLPYGVRPIPAVSAPDTTTAYYLPGAADGSRAGYYYVNLYQPQSRPRWEMLPLTLHEAVPGHHFQFARSLEIPDAPMFRKTAYFVAYSEGWALYAEQLGYDMGLYDDPYDRLGQLTYEMWRAVRLVVDTGIHAKGWTREQAIAFFKDNAAKADLDIVNEIDRYIGDPGQALAYKVGQLKISEMRARAKAALGERFDLRDFNDAVLEVGSVPLTTLEWHIDRWIRHQAASSN